MKNLFFILMAVVALSGCTGDFAALPQGQFAGNETATAWHNSAFPTDANGNGIGPQQDYESTWLYSETSAEFVWADDVVCEGYSERNRQEQVGMPHPHMRLPIVSVKLNATRPAAHPFYLDVNNDGYLTAMDCQLVLVEYLKKFSFLNRDPYRGPAAQLDSALGLHLKDGNEELNALGKNEKSLYDAWGDRYIILPDGKFYWIDPVNGMEVFVEAFSALHYNNLSLLHNAYIP